MGKVRDMFGSALLTEAVISDAGRYDPDHPLMKTCYAFHLDVVEREHDIFRKYVGQRV